MTQPHYPPSSSSQAPYSYGAAGDDLLPYSQPAPTAGMPPTQDGVENSPRKALLERASVRTVGTGLIALALIGLGVVIGRASDGGVTAEEDDSSTVAEAAAPEAPRLKDAYDSCWKSGIGQTVQLGDGGTSIIVDTGSEYGSVDSVVCIMDEIETPQSVVAQVSSTTALMGVQEAEHDGFEYSWSYHPDNGLNMVITDVEASD